MNVTAKELDDICDVLDYFEFEKVAQVMEFLDWKYLDEDNPRIPDIPELRQKARRALLHCAVKCKEEGREATFQCGGFYACAEMIEGKLFIELQFILTEFNNFE
jgi:hypothetical protein